MNAGTVRLPVRDTQSIATFTIVFLEPLKSDNKILIKAKSTEVRLLGSCDAFQCTDGDPASTSSLSIKSFIYLFIYFWNCPSKKVLILERKWGKLSHPFGVSVNPQPWKQVQPVDCNFRKQATLTSIQPLLLSSLAERQRPYGGSGGG